MPQLRKTLEVKRSGTVLEIALARPQVKNAFNPEMIRELSDVFAAANVERDLRVVALTGSGGTFCSGGDLNWMKETLDYTPEENRRDAEDLYRLFETMDTCKLPLVCGVEGFALGGGVGLVSASDYVVAERKTQFSLAEVKVGLVPACIGPFVLRKIGPSQARALFLTSERFGAEHAFKIGLVHEVAEGPKALQAALARVIGSICSASPQAVGVAKRFLRRLGELPFTAQASFAVETLAEIRVTPEAQEGLRAFLEKRPPLWQKE